MSRTIATEDGVLVIPGGDPPPVDYPALMDKLLFPEGEVAPTEVKLDTPPSEGLACVHCAAMLNGRDPKKVAVDCGHHVWLTPAHVQIYLVLRGLDFPVWPDVVKVEGNADKFSFVTPQLRYKELDRLAAAFDTKAIDFEPGADEATGARFYTVTVREPVLASAG
jgi:hypothetical protein